MKKKKFIILIIIICAGLIIWYFNTFTIKTNYEIIESEKIVDEITIIQISDLHGSSFGRNNKELIKKIEKVEKFNFLSKLFTSNPSSLKASKDV